MNKMMLAGLVLLAGCSTQTQKQSVSLILDADLASGKLMLTCRDSSSGTCHVLVAGGNGGAVRLSAAKGATAENPSGAADGARFCAGASEPQNGCRLTVLRDGENIFRSSAVQTQSH